MNYTWPKTQKARGVLALTHGLKCGYWPARSPMQIVVVPSQEAGACSVGRMPHWGAMALDGGESLQYLSFPCFGRPCPTKPRHGFVASRRLTDAISALDLLAETLRADPKGEMILMPEYTGRYSAVATNAGIAWGLGNAGVTEGAEEASFIPAHLPANLWAGLAAARLHRVSCPYIELVENDGDVYLVQTRDGPPQSAAHGDYIPRKMTVTSIIYPGAVALDLLRWDKLVREASPGTVAVLPTTMTRFSHFAVHCLVKKMPIIFGRAPLIGARLVPSEDEPRIRLTPADYKHIARVIMNRFADRKAIVEDNTTHPEAKCVTTAIGVCHAMPNWGAEDHLLRLRGEGAAACFRYSAAACLGEIRHFCRGGPGGRTLGRAPCTDMSLLLNSHESAQFVRREDVSRNAVYTRMSLLPISTQITLLGQAHRDFKQSGWHGSFGGQSWAEAAYQTARLGRTIIAFCTQPDTRRWHRLQLCYNATLHACHNNGKVLTKWVPGDALRYGGQAPTLCFMNSFAAETVLYPPELPPFAALKQKFEEENCHGK